MIQNVKHRGLKRLFQRGDASGVPAEHLERIDNILTVLNVATTPADADLPGLRLHPLKGDLKGYWSLTVSANTRIIFRIEDGDVCDVDLTDYH